MIKQERLYDWKRLIDKALAHLDRGAELWNSVGLDSPELASEIAIATLAEYQKSIALLKPEKFINLAEKTRKLISGYREIAFAQAASAQTFLQDKWSDDGLKNIIELTRQEINHLKRAITHFESQEELKISLPDLRTTLLFSEGEINDLMSRLALREENFVDASRFTTLSQDKFHRIMETYELETPELVSIKNSVEQAQNRRQARISESEENGEATQIRWIARILRVIPQSPELPNEDLYRRAASNYYARASLIAHLDAIAILKNQGDPQDVDKKFEESTEYLYSAIEIFPRNLEFHEDLFNSWRARGELFACPMKETERYYHIQCPLAIINFAGGWYVSPTLEYETLRCTVCRKDALECTHYPGEVVNDRIVQYEPDKVILSSVSVVDVPEDPECRLEWISIPKSYFTDEITNLPRLQCAFCNPEKYQRSLRPFLVGLPESLEQEMENMYKQIMNSRSYRPINLKNDHVQS